MDGGKQAADQRLEDDGPDEGADGHGEVGADKPADRDSDHAEQCAADEVPGAPVHERGRVDRHG